MDPARLALRAKPRALALGNPLRRGDEIVRRFGERALSAKDSARLEIADRAHCGELGAVSPLPKRVDLLEKPALEEVRRAAPDPFFQNGDAGVEHEVEDRAQSIGERVAALLGGEPSARAEDHLESAAEPH